MTHLHTNARFVSRTYEVASTAWARRDWMTNETVTTKCKF